MAICEICGIARSDAQMRERVCFGCIGDLVRPALLFGVGCLVLTAILTVVAGRWRDAAAGVWFYAPFSLGILFAILGLFGLAFGTVAFLMLPQQPSQAEPPASGDRETDSLWEDL